jgi:hypothetical protein
MALTTLLVAVPAHLLGKREEDERRWFKNYRVPSFFEASLECTMDYVRNSVEKNDVLFLGDSTCNVGVDTGQFQQATGLVCYNLGAPGEIWIRGLALILEDYLKHHPKPRVVVICVLPEVFGGHGPTGPLGKQFFWTFGAATEDDRPHHHLFSFDYVREGIRISYGHLRGGVAHFTNAPGFNATEQSFATWGKQFRQQRGFIAAPGTNDNLSVPGRVRSLTVSPEALDALHTLAHLTAKEGILLMIRPSPIRATVAPEQTAGLVSSFREFEREWPHVIVSRPEVLTYDPRHFFDEVHMDVRGAERFTSFLVREVANCAKKKR